MAKARKKASKRRGKARKNPVVSSYATLEAERANGVTNFSDSVLRGEHRDYGDTDLSGLSMTGAIFRNVSFRDGNLSGTDFWRAEFIKSDLEEANLKGSIFLSAKFDHTILHMVDAEGANFTDAWLQSAIMRGGNFRLANFYGANLEFVQAEESSFEKARFEKTEMKGGNFDLSDFNGAMFDGANLFRASFQGSDFSGATFKNMDWSGVNLLGAENVDQVVLEEWWDSEKDRYRGVAGGLEAVEKELGIGSRSGAARPALGWDEDKRRQRDDENLAWSMEHQAPGVGDEERAARWRDEDVEVLGAQPPAELVGAAEETDDALRAWMQPGIKQKLGVWNPKKRKAKEPDEHPLIKKAHRLWESYDAKPLKKNLVAFGKHIEKMKKSKSLEVKVEAERAAKAFNKEFKVRGWKK